MRRFRHARAKRRLSIRSATYVGRMDHPLSLHWLAGLLEAEGSFMSGPPSSPNLPLVTCSMTDRDVVERVAGMFGTAVCKINKGRHLTEYRAVAKGSRAVALMADLHDAMGVRQSTRRSSAMTHPHESSVSRQLRRFARSGRLVRRSLTWRGSTTSAARRSVRCLSVRSTRGCRTALGGCRPLGFPIDSPIPRSSPTNWHGWAGGLREREASFLHRRPALVNGVGSPARRVTST